MTKQEIKIEDIRKGDLIRYEYENPQVSAIRAIEYVADWDGQVRDGH